MVDSTKTSLGMQDFVKRGTVSEIARDINRLKKTTRDLVNASNIVTATQAIITNSNLPIGEGNPLSLYTDGSETILRTWNSSITTGEYITIDIACEVFWPPATSVPGDLIRVTLYIQNSTFGPTAVLTGDMVYSSEPDTDYYGHIFIDIFPIPFSSQVAFIAYGKLNGGFPPRPPSSNTVEFKALGSSVEDLSILTDFTLTGQSVSADPSHFQFLKAGTVFTKYPLS